MNWINTQPVSTNIQGWAGSSCYYPVFSPSYTIIEAVRPLACIAYGTAAQLQTGIYSPSVAGGVSTADAIQQAEMAIRGVAFSCAVNVANPTTSNCWGYGTPGDSNGQWHNAQNYGTWAAEAAWMLWDKLDSTTQLAVAKMVEYDANTLAATGPAYWANKNGNILTPGDTQMEEDAWSGHMLTQAQAMMPNHPNAALWRQSASQWNVATYSRQSDLTNTTLVDGKQVKQYLNGFNVFPDGVLVNHGIVHPDYITDDTHRYQSLVDVSLAGQYAMQSMTYNADLAYQRVDGSTIYARARHQVPHRRDDRTAGWNHLSTGRGRRLQHDDLLSGRRRSGTGSSTPIALAWISTPRIWAWTRERTTTP